MSNEENEGEDLKAFERAMAALRPRADRLDPAWRSMLAKEVSLTAGLADRPSRRRGRAARCDHPAGHRYVCLHCGGDAPQPGGVGRWAWPGALAATTSVAAVLLAMLLIGRHDRSVGREGPSIAATAAIPATQAKGEVASVTEQAETPPEGPAAADFPGIVPQSVAWRGRSNRGILTAADTELGDDLLERNNLPASRTVASTADVVAADARVTNSKFAVHPA